MPQRQMVDESVRQIPAELHTIITLLNVFNKH